MSFRYHFKEAKRASQQKIHENHCFRTHRLKFLYVFIQIHNQNLTYKIIFLIEYLLAVVAAVDTFAKHHKISVDSIYFFSIARHHAKNNVYLVMNSGHVHCREIVRLFC